MKSYIHFVLIISDGFDVFIVKSRILFLSNNNVPARVLELTKEPLESL